jgi:hypothetical protein
MCACSTRIYFGQHRDAVTVDLGRRFEGPGLLAVIPVAVIPVAVIPVAVIPVAVIRVLMVRKGRRAKKYGSLHSTFGLDYT